MQSGSTAATFDVRKPRWSTQSSADRPCIGRIKRIVVQEAGAFSGRYELMVSLKRPEEEGSCYSFKIRNAPDKRTYAAPDVNTPIDIIRRLSPHFIDAAAHFPEAHRIPEIQYDSNNYDRFGAAPYFIYLPARSAIYTTDEQFFRALGFHDDQYDLGMYRKMMTESARNRIERRVYGFFNEDYNNYRRIEAAAYTRPDQTLDQFLDSLTDEANSERTIVEGDEEEDAEETVLKEYEKLTKIVILQIEMLDFDKVLIPGDGLEHFFDQEVGAAVLNTLTDSMRRACNLANQPVRARTHGSIGRDPNTQTSFILLENRLVDNSSAWIEITLTREMNRRFSRLDDAPMLFQLKNRTEYQLLTTSSAKNDPFKFKYPVRIQSKNFGPVSSFVKELGYVHVMGIMYDGGWDNPLDAEWAEFRSDSSHLTLEFYDFANQQIVFPSAFILHLMLEFKPFTIDDLQVLADPSGHARGCLQSHHKRQ
jgi:hypothetical protein